MRKLIIKIIDHNGSDIDRMFEIGNGYDLPDVQKEVNSLIETLDTDFETGRINKEVTEE